MLLRVRKNVPVSPTDEIRAVPNIRWVMRLLGQTEQSGVTADGLFAVWADDESAVQRRLISMLGSARAIIFHGLPLKPGCSILDGVLSTRRNKPSHLRGRTETFAVRSFCHLL